MAQLTLAKLMDAVLDEIPQKEQAPIVRAVNKVIRRIQSEFVEPVRSTFTTKAPLSTGTVAVVNNNATITFSGNVLSASDPLMLVQIEGDNTWFPLVYASASTGTLPSVWAATSDPTATYNLVYPSVSFPKEVGQVLKIRQEGFRPLKFMIGEGCPYTTGSPQAWSPYYHDAALAAPADDLLRYFLSPAPDSMLVFQFWYRPRTAFIDTAAATTVVVPLPDIWEEAIIEGTLYWLWKQEGQNQKALLQMGLFEGALARARGAADAPIEMQPRTRSGGLYAYEERPIGGQP